MDIRALSVYLDGLRIEEKNLNIQQQKLETELVDIQQKTRLISGYRNIILHIYTAIYQSLAIGLKNVVVRLKINEPAIPSCKLDKIHTDLYSILSRFSLENLRVESSEYAKCDRNITPEDAQNYDTFIFFDV